MRRGDTLGRISRTGWGADFQWWLLKTVLRWYVRDSLRYSYVRDRWKSIYVGINCGASNGEDERHLVYINRDKEG